MKIRTRLFTLKKWLLLSCCFVALTLIIYFTMTTTNYIDYHVDDDDDEFNNTLSLLKYLHQNYHSNYTQLFTNTTSNFDRSEDQKTANFIIIGIGVISTLIHMMGLIATLKELCCLIMTYATICMIILVLNIVALIQIPAGCIGDWLLCAIYFLIACLGISLARDIKRLPPQYSFNSYLLSKSNIRLLPSQTLSNKSEPALPYQNPKYTGTVATGQSPA